MLSVRRLNAAGVKRAERLRASLLLLPLLPLLLRDGRLVRRLLLCGVLRRRLPARHAFVARLPVLVVLVLLHADVLRSQRMVESSIRRSCHVCAGSGRRRKAAAAGAGGRSVSVRSRRRMQSN